MNKKEKGKKGCKIKAGRNKDEGEEGRNRRRRRK